jgi:hypothetical protein
MHAHTCASPERPLQAQLYHRRNPNLANRIPAQLMANRCLLTPSTQAPKHPIPTVSHQQLQSVTQPQHVTIGVTTVLTTYWRLLRKVLHLWIPLRHFGTYSINFCNVKWASRWCLMRSTPGVLWHGRLILRHAIWGRGEVFLHMWLPYYGILRNTTHEGHRHTHAHTIWSE